MEYVDGPPINDYCDRHRLTMRQRMELLVQVCEGVRHAHQKAIIHRDLKPTNILVTEVDGKPAPHHRLRHRQNGYRQVSAIDKVFDAAFIAKGGLSFEEETLKRIF